MSEVMRFAGRWSRWIVLLTALAGVGVQADTRQLAPGFAKLDAGAKLVLMPIDVELFSLSAGGVAEPRADWTRAAQQHMQQAMTQRANEWGLSIQSMSEAEADGHAEQVALHAAVAQAIALHHGIGGNFALPSKEGKLDWSFDTAMRDIGTASGARYGLFVWVRDSYASAERKAMMIGLALLGVGVGGGVQVGYASLVDLQSGQVLWFNRLARASGDLREAAPAAESVAELLKAFPAAR